MTVRAALAAAAEIGPFFRVRIVDPVTFHPEQTLSLLHEPGPALTERVQATADALGVTDHRVAGSIFFQGLAARLWSPVLAVAVRERHVLRLPPQHTVSDDQGLGCTQPTLSPVPPESGDGDVDAAAVPDRERDEPSAVLADEVHRAVIELHLEPLATALGVSPTTLWGNTASALVGSYQVMTAAHPDLADAELLISLLRTGRLAGTGRLDDDGRFHRNSCCLYYRVPGGGLCGDCVLHRRGRSGR